MSRKGLSLLPSDYKKVARLGEGMGTVVWQVKHVATGEVFALKIDNEPDPTHRLQREFAILKRLDIPGIARVKGSGQHQGRDYFTMELVDGKPLSSFMVERRSEKSFVERFLEVFQNSLVILTDLHKQGVVHIDVKPSNLLVTEDGEPVLLDFGFAEDYVLSPTAEPSGTTLDYAAPELFTGGQVLPAADIYSMGAIAYEVLSRRKLWEGMKPRELIAAKLRTPPGLGKIEYDIPPGLEALVLRMLCPDPGLRPLAAEVLSEISWLTTGEKAVVSAPVMVSRLVFGGRDEETEELERLVFNEKKVVLLSGDSGMGKTRLLRELRFKALVDDRSVLYIEGRGMHLSLTEHLGSALGLDNTVNSGDKWSRFERVYQGVEKGGFDGVFIDAPLDLSEDEKGLLGYLSRGFDGKLGLILSQVPRDVHPNARELVLSSLDQVEVGALVSRTFEGLKEGNQLVQVLSSIAKGNPRRMNELLDILYSEGWLSWKRGWVYETRKDAEGLAQKLKDWLAESIAKLDKNSRVVLDMLALAEGALPGEVIEKILGENTQMTIASLHNAGLVRSFPYLERPHYEFENDVVKSYLQDNLAGERGRSLAKKTAEVSEDFCVNSAGTDPMNWEESYLLNVASLLYKAGEKNKTAGYLIAAGNRLGSSGNLRLSKKLLERSLECNPTVIQRKEALYRLGGLARAEDAPDKAEELFTQILPYVENENEKMGIFLDIALGYQNQSRDLERAKLFLDKCRGYSGDSSGDIEYRRLYTLAWNAYYRGDYKESESIFNKAIKIAQPADAPYKSIFGLGAILTMTGELTKGLELEKESLELAKKTCDKVTVVSIILNIIEPLRRLNRFDEVYSYLGEAFVAAQEIQHPIVIASVLRQEAITLICQGKNIEARSTIHRAIELYAKVNARMKIVELLIEEAQILIETGDFENAQGILMRLWKENHCSKVGSQRMGVLQQWALLYTRRGLFIPAERMYQKAQTVAKSISYMSQYLWIETRLCDLYIMRDAMDNARASFQKCKEMFEKYGYPTLGRTISVLEASILLKEGSPSSALRILSELMDSSKNTTHKLGETNVRFCLSMTLVALGKFDEGMTEFRRCLAEYKSRGKFYEQGLVNYSIAEVMLEHQGYSEKAVESLDEAETIFWRLGARNQLEKIKELRAKHFRGFQEQVTPSLKNLEALSRINELISKRLGKDGFINDLLDITLNLTKAQRGLIMVAESEEFYPIASKEMDPATSTDALRISETIMNQVVTEKCPIYTSDALLDERFSKAQSILINEIRSFICVPLKTDEELAGTIYLDSKKTGLFKPDNMFYFETLGNLLAPSIKRTAEYKRLSEKLASRRGASDAGKRGIFLGSSHAIKKLQRDLVKIAGTDSNVLLEGETGSGKGVFARLIHMLSGRNEKEFCPINCGILPENIFETELFGTRKGAYTGAVEDRKGLLEASNCSTVFFDEITNTTLTLQAKLLEVIEDKVIRRVGENKRRQVDLRFIFATNRDLEEEVHQGRFREDLFFRINTITLKVPPLRDLREDLPEYVDFFLKESSRELGSEVRGIEKPALDRLVNYSWPGNVREMKNVIHRLVLMAHGSTITSELLDQHFAPVSSRGTKHLRRSREETLKERVHRALVVCEGNVTRAAKSMGVSRRHFYRLMERFKISKDNY